MPRPEEKNYSTFEEAEISAEISKRVFDSEFKHLKERLDKQESVSFNIIIGAVLATFLILAGLTFSTWLFMAQYNQSFIQTRDTVQGEMQEMRKENFDFKESLITEFQTKQSKQQNVETPKLDSSTQ